MPGARDVECVEEVVSETKQRTGGRVLRVITSDAYPAYEAAILAAYGQDRATTPGGRESRRMVPEFRRSGYDVTFREFDGPHGVPPEVARGAMEWFLK